MKNFIKSILLFSLFLIVFYTFAIFIWGLYVPSCFKPNLNYCLGLYGHMYSRLTEVKKVNKVDILFLGSSLGYREFDPRIFKANGITSFNLGSSSQTPVQTVVLLKRYFNQINPKLIIYEVDPDAFSSDGVESSLDIISNDKNDLNSIKMAFKTNHIKVYNTLIYALLRDFFNLNSSFTEQNIIDDDTYIPGGYVEKKISFFRNIKYPQNKWNFNEIQFIAFDEIVLMIKKRNIKLILVYAPLTSSLYKSYTNNQTFDDKMKKYGCYYNFNEILNLNDSLHFYDQVHLNQNGVEIFNNKLIEKLIKTNNLTQTQ